MLQSYTPSRKSKSPGQRRAEIKARAFAGSGVTSKGRRHRQPSKRSKDSEDKSEAPKKKGRSKVYDTSFDSEQGEGKPVEINIDNV